MKAQISKLEELAGYFTIMATGSSIIAALLLVVACVSRIGDGKWGDGLSWSAVLIVVSLAAFLFAQLLHIRVLLQKIAPKD